MKQLLKELGFEHLPMLSEFEYKLFGIGAIGYMNSMHDYKELITQPLTKGMFIPCSEDDKMIYRNDDDCYYVLTEHGEYFISDEQYQQAKDRVLFEGWDYLTVNSLQGFKTIEQAINNGVKLILKE